MRLMFVVALLATLPGCGAIQNYQNGQRLAEAKAQFDAAMSRCESGFPSAKPMTPRAKCFATARIEYMEQVSNNGDLVRQMNARMVALAERFDAGKVTTTQWEAEHADIVVAYETQVRQRGNEAAMANAAVMSAYAANAPRSCTKVGNTVNCF